MTVSEKIEHFHSRGQVDVIETWINEETNYKYLFIYEDCFSRFVVFKAMRTNSTQETARKLFDVITMIGAPLVLQSPKGREFAKQVIEELKFIWDHFAILHGETLKMERSSRNFKEPVDTWLAANPTKSWLDAIKIIQACENKSFKHSDGKVPFDLLFNCSLKDPFCNQSINFQAEEDWLAFKANNFNSSKDVNNDIQQKNHNNEISEQSIISESDFHFVDVRNELSINQFSADSTPSEEEESTKSKKFSIVSKYNCKLCSKTFQVQNLLSKHTKRCHRKNASSSPKLCIPTSKSAAPKSKRKSSLSPTLECNHCKQKFVFPSVLKRHMRSHTNERPYSCQICGKSFKQLGHLTQHTVTHTDYRSNHCAQCDVKFESLEAFKLHVLSHEEPVSHRLFECDVCKKVFASKGVLERHIVTHTHERMFACDECGKRFKQAGHVKSHMLVHTGEKKFACTICEKRFSLANSLKKHMFVHNGEKPYQCDVCGARFLEKRNLNGHIMTHTNERPHSCKICGKRYTLADTLRRHISAAHELGRTYQCEICAKMFKQLAHLSVHKKVHTDERPFQCHLCAKSFKHNNVLKSHLAIHANLRPFECDLCQATFVRKTNLQIHIKAAHMNERPYVCRICGKKFKQISHLNGHVVVHSNSMPYQCDFCERRCNRLDNLKKHMRLHERDREKKEIC